MKKQIANAAKIAVAGFLFGLFVTRILLLLRIDNYRENSVVSENVLAGTPIWRAFQNRLLSPSIQSGFGQILHFFGLPHSDSASYDIYMAVAVAGVVICYGLIALSAFARTSERIAYFSSILLCYIFIQDKSWLYPWDPVEIIVFCILYILIIKQRPIWNYWVLFSLALLNKETTAAIGLWLVIDSIYISDKVFFLKNINKLKIFLPKLLSGLIMIAITAITVHELRENLFISNYDLHHTKLNPQRYISSNPWMGETNIKTIGSSLFYNILSFSILEFIVITIIIFSVRFKNYNKIDFYDLKIILFGFALVSVFLGFALIDEIRALNYAIPFIFHTALVGHFSRHPADPTRADAHH